MDIIFVQPEVLWTYILKVLKLLLLMIKFIQKLKKIMQFEKNLN